MSFRNHAVSQVELVSKDVVSRVKRIHKPGTIEELRLSVLEAFSLESGTRVSFMATDGQDSG